MVQDFINIKKKGFDNLFICLKETRTLNGFGNEVDKCLGGLLTKALSQNKWFRGKLGEYISVVCPNESYSTVVIVGVEDISTIKGVQQIGGTVSSIMRRLKLNNAGLYLDAKCEALLIAHLELGFKLKSWSFDKYKTKKKDSSSSTSLTLKVISDVQEKAEEIYKSQLEPLYTGIIKARELINEPANVINPATFAKHAEEMTSLNLKVEILSKSDMAKLGMNALLGVAQGSVNEPKMAIIKWKGAGENDPYLAFVGKGLTFDSGGISIKPSRNMDQMKSDMSGAATVLGLMCAVAGRKAPVNVIGIAALAENMPSGHAQRPGDIVKTMSGQTVEVLDTDAEGRLVLADALWYTFDRFKPKAIIDLATLTGAIQIALGTEFAGLFSNDDKLANVLSKSGDRVGEKLWRMPLSNDFDRQIDSDIADMKNLGTPGKAGSSTAAQFLQRFIGKISWAHLDIAGVAYSEKDSLLSCKGGVGYGVQLLNDFVSSYDWK